MKKIIRTQKAPAPIGPYNQAVLAGGALYVSGQIALDAQTGQLERSSIEAETRKALQNLEAVLQEAEFALTDVVKCSVFVADMGQFAQINEVYGEFFGEASPARETVEVSRLPKDANVEVSCIAVRATDDDLLYAFAETKQIEPDAETES